MNETDKVRLPADGADAELAMKEALFKKATGYYVDEVTEVIGGKLGDQTITKRIFIPGDPKAMREYRQLYGDGI